MSAAQNIALGHEPTRGITGVLNWPAIHAKASTGLAELGVAVDLKAPVRHLSIAQKQLVEIVKALSLNAQILVMDEPTSSLTEAEIAGLFKTLRALKTKGVSVIFITHHVEEIFDIADRVTVLRDGKNVATSDAHELDKARLIQMMVGRAVDSIFPKDKRPRGPEALRVQGLERKGVLHGINFTAYEGEILGIAGLMGAGRTELARAIFGADAIDAGEVYIQRKRVHIRSPYDAIRNGMSLLTEDRKGQGLVLQMPVKDNIVLAGLQTVSRGPLLDRAKVRQVAGEYVEELDIKTPNLDRAIKFLSGGNQQKAILAKWLHTGAKILIFDEPTRGIDVGAKAEVHRLMNRLAQQGACIIMISSELPEVLGMSDRILVMAEGRLVAELSREQATQELIMTYATGGTKDES
jgi:ribose transport system ATP-binding protein